MLVHIVDAPTDPIARLICIHAMRTIIEKYRMLRLMAVPWFFCWSEEEVKTSQIAWRISKSWKWQLEKIKHSPDLHKSIGMLESIPSTDLDRLFSCPSAQLSFSCLRLIGLLSFAGLLFCDRFSLESTDDWFCLEFFLSKYLTSGVLSLSLRGVLCFLSLLYRSHVSATL